MCDKLRLAILDPSSYTLPYDFFYLRELCKKGYIVDFYCSNTKYNIEFLEAICDLPVNVKVFNVSPSITHNLFLSVYNYSNMLKTLWQKRNEYDYIHFFWSVNPFQEILFLPFFREKLIFTFHNPVPHNWNNKVYLPYKIFYNLSSKVLFVSNSSKEYFIYYYKPINTGKIYYLQHGIMSVLPNEQFVPVVTAKTCDKKIVFCGNVKYYKGINFFIKIAKSNKFSDFSLEVYGKWDRKLFPLKKELSLYKNVLIVDSFLSLRELRKIMDLSAIFVLPYIRASQSGILYTLLFYNRIFLSSPVGDNYDFLKRNHLDDLIFDPKDFSSFEKSFSFAFLNYQDLVFKISKIRNNYSWEKIMENFNLYEK